MLLAIRPVVGGRVDVAALNIVVAVVSRSDIYQPEILPLEHIARSGGVWCRWVTLGSSRGNCWSVLEMRFEL